jgi:hypothetical protein
MKDPVPPPPDSRDLLNRIVERRAEELYFIAVGAIEAGVVKCSLLAGRPGEESDRAAIVLVLSGKMTDADIRRFKEYVLGFEQDVNPGRKVGIKIEDNLKPEVDKP